MKRKHHDVLAWQQGILLVKAVYRLTAGFPQSELYGLTSQMRRAAVSVPAYIAEGMGRNTTKELLQILIVARGSLSELDTCVVLSKELGFAASTEDIAGLVDRVFALIGGLINSHRRSG